MLKNQQNTDFFVYNAEDVFCAGVASRAKARTVPFSSARPLKEGAWVQDGHLMIAGRALCPVEELSLKGSHNLENALAAAAIAWELAVPAPVIRHALRTFQGVEHRMETVCTIDGICFINDSKGTNPESSLHAVRSMSQKTALIAGGDDKETDFSNFIGEILNNRNIAHVVLIGKSAEKMQMKLEKEGYLAFTNAGFDFEKAVSIARGQVADGGTVLLSPACASFDMFKDFEERGSRFKEIVQMLR
jgi:UDP-N-acetylmuramoylalanine--D-glutamate ligase